MIIEFEHHTPLKGIIKTTFNEKLCKIEILSCRKKRQKPIWKICAYLEHKDHEIEDE